jgi:hypothetical protein
MRTRYIWLSFVMAVLCALGGHAQEMNSATATKKPNPCGSVKSEMTYVAEGEPSINSSIASRDLETITVAQQRVKQEYAKRGFDDCAAMEATALAWRDLRLSQPKGQLEEGAIVKLANEGFGGLKITSVPAGASIRVDGKSWDQPTNTTSWTHVGKRIITLSLAGYQDSTGEEVVRPGASVEYHKKLVKK